MSRDLVRFVLSSFYCNAILLGASTYEIGWNQCVCLCETIVRWNFKRARSRGVGIKLGRSHQLAGQAVSFLFGTMNRPLSSGQHVLSVDNCLRFISFSSLRRNTRCAYHSVLGIYIGSFTLICSTADKFTAWCCTSFEVLLAGCAFSHLWGTGIHSNPSGASLHSL